MDWDPVEFGRRMVERAHEQGQEDTPKTDAEIEAEEVSRISELIASELPPAAVPMIWQVVAGLLIQGKEPLQALQAAVIKVSHLHDALRDGTVHVGVGLPSEGISVDSMVRGEILGELTYEPIESSLLAAVRERNPKR